MSKEPFVVGPSRKPGFWASIERLNRADEKAAKKVKPADTEISATSRAARGKRPSTSAKKAAKKKVARK